MLIDLTKTIMPLTLSVDNTAYNIGIANSGAGHWNNQQQYVSS